KAALTLIEKYEPKNLEPPIDLKEATETKETETKIEIKQEDQKIKTESIIHNKNELNQTALMWASYHHLTKVVSKLIELKVDINAVDVAGRSAFYYCCLGI